MADTRTDRRRFRQLALVGAVAATALLISSAPPPPTAAAVTQTPVAADGAPPLEPIEVERRITLALPPGTSLDGNVELTPDGRHLAVPVSVAGAAQLAVTDLDGANYRCVTCGWVDTARKTVVLGDERRVWYADADGQDADGGWFSGGTGDFQWYVLECAPSVYDCAEGVTYPVRFPTDSVLQGAQNREAKPDRWGEYVYWNEVSAVQGTRMSIARLTREDDRYRLTGQRVLNPGYTTSGTAADWFAGTRFYEGSTPQAGGRLLKYQTTTTALNYDIWTIDLMTGERSQLTPDLLYNEIGEISPDGTAAYYSSARGLDRMDVFTQPVRPPLLDANAFGQIGRVSLWNNRRCMNEPWLMDAGYRQRPDGYAGQPIVLEEGWTAREWSWFPDSTGAVVTEQQVPAGNAGPGDPGTPRRVSVVRLPARQPAAPLPPVHLDQTNWLRWTIPADEYRTTTGRQIVERGLAGTTGGTATVTFTGTYTAGTWTVTYRDYSDDGGSYLNGTESVTVANPALLAVWSADLTVRGTHTGYLDGTVTVGPQNTYQGTVESVVDGVHRAGIPTQDTCPGTRQPALAVAADRASAGSVRVTVTATVPEDSWGRPVRAAAVTATSGDTTLTASTDERGQAVLALAPDRRWAITAEAGGFRAATRTVG